MVSLLRMAFLAGLYAYGKQTNNNSENCPEDSPPGDFVFTERSAHSRHGDRSSAEMFLTRIISLRYREVGELWLTCFSPSLIRPKQYLDAIRKVFPRTEMGKDRRSVVLNFEEE